MINELASSHLDLFLLLLATPTLELEIKHLEVPNTKGYKFLKVHKALRNLLNVVISPLSKCEEIFIEEMSTVSLLWAT